MRHFRAWSAVLGGAWLMDEERVRLMLDIIERPRSEHEIQALETQLGRRLDNSHGTTMRGGVAIIPITGPIFRYADMFTQASGATATEHLSLDISQALDNPMVDAILLNVDSPGGEATGINELADAIMVGRTKKPMWAYVEGLAASAAYWLASATARIVIDETAALGSIGVVMAVPDPTKRTAKDIEFVSSQSPNKRPDPATERGKAQLQQIVDDMAAVFVDRVAAHRGVSSATVQHEFGAGGLKIGQSAVRSHLADALGSFEGTLAALQQHVSRRQMESQRRMLAEEPAAFFRQQLRSK